MNITRKALEFERWYQVSEFSESLEKENIEEYVLAWADKTETDLEDDNLNDICERIIELGIC